MTVLNRDQLITALAAATTAPFYKTSSTTVAGRPWTLFRNAGNPVGGSTPSSTGNALDRTTQGALAIPSPSNVSYLVGVNIASTTTQGYLVYDRLVETGGLSGTSTSAQTVNSTSLPSRNTTGAGTELWLEVYTAIGSSSVTCTASYTNQAGTSGRTATLVGNTFTSMAANTTQPFALQSGDTGVRSVQSVTLGSSTGTAGNFGITLRQLIATVAPEGSAGITAPWSKLNLPVVPDSACLEVLILPTGTSSGVMLGNVRIGQG